MRRIATFAGLCALEVLPVRLSVFFHTFKSLERLPKLATSYMRTAYHHRAGILRVLCGLVVGVYGLVPPATAMVLEIPAVSFVLRCSTLNCPGTGTDALGEAAQGLLLNA